MSSEDAWAIETDGLTKRYIGDVLAVDRLSSMIADGVTYALLGPNGAGKTTTISMLTTLLKPAGGRVSVGWTGQGMDGSADRVVAKDGETP